MTLPVTGIGSVPFTTIIEAIQFSEQHPIPFLPELTRFEDEKMLAYIESPGHLRALEAFQRRSYERVKIQSLGPVTTVVCTQYPGGAKYTPDQAVRQVQRHLGKILEGLVADEVIVFLDEPALAAEVNLPAEELWSQVFRYIRDPKIKLGVHNCGQGAFDRMFNADIEIVSVDANRYGRQIRPFLERRGGKRIAWGIKSIEDVLEFKPGDLITAPCGLTFKEIGPLGKSVFYTVPECEAIYSNLMDIARKLTAKP
ncbi:MAG: hypothetical protein Q8L34_04860 [Candidatus Woesearchaeota archaeon]|nr:hypothetical protein [Candidatus Woesearchaeota archaeon]